jgi:hypothetical protein
MAFTVNAKMPRLSVKAGSVIAIKLQSLKSPMGGS